MLYESTYSAKRTEEEFRGKVESMFRIKVQVGVRKYNSWARHLTPHLTLVVLAAGRPVTYFRSDC
ncbi:hypothetical protein J6590_049908 [Homalodisca vitripennis]|nr:hypothetical protein J6590_049908 [Homalodisca vitripennis]